MPRPTLVDNPLSPPLLHPSRRPAPAPLARLLLALLPAAMAAEPKADVAPARAAAGQATGALVIVGGGLLPDVIRDHFLQLAGGKNGRLVVIPTASERIDATPADSSAATATGGRRGWPRWRCCTRSTPGRPTRPPSSSR